MIFEILSFTGCCPVSVSDGTSPLLQDMDSPAQIGDERKLLITMDPEADQSQLSIGDGLDPLDTSGLT